MIFFSLIELGKVQSIIIAGLSQVVILRKKFPFATTRNKPCKKKIYRKYDEIVIYLPKYFFFCSICERITPRLAHANAAVVLSAVKVLMKFMEMLPSDSDFVVTLTKKLAPPLVTLLSSEPEVIYYQS